MASGCAPGKRGFYVYSPRSSQPAPPISPCPKIARAAAVMVKVNGHLCGHNGSELCQADCSAGHSI